MGATEEQIESFPWIIWFIWKARNEKAFNGEEISALDTAQWATSESRCWKMAHVVSSILENEDDVPPETSSQVTEEFVWPVCQSDASWEQHDRVAGLGFITANADGSSLYGSKACPNVQSSMHAEIEALLWAMKNTSDVGYTSIHLQTDCLQVLKMVQEEEEWPAFASEMEEFTHLKLNFTRFVFSYIPRTLNTRADSLAKGARSRGSLFADVQSLPPNGLSLEANRVATTS